MILITGTEGSFAVFDVKVTNWLGLPPFWTRVLPILGTVLGPILTVPWWLERRRSSGTPTEEAAIAGGENEVT